MPDLSISICIGVTLVHELKADEPGHKNRSYHRFVGLTGVVENPTWAREKSYHDEILP